MTALALSQPTDTTGAGHSLSAAASRARWCQAPLGGRCGVCY